MSQFINSPLSGISPLLVDTSTDEFDEFDDIEFKTASKWNHFRIVSHKIFKNTNWLATISAALVVIALSVMCSNLITTSINEGFIQQTLHDTEAIMHRNLLTVGDGETVTVTDEPPMTREQKVIEGLEQDIMGEKDVEIKLIRRIKKLEKIHLQFMAENRKHENNMIYIGTTITGIVFIASALMLYEIVKSSNKSNTELQNNQDPSQRAPIGSTQINTTNNQ